MLLHVLLFSLNSNGNCWFLEKNNSYFIERGFYLFTALENGYRSLKEHLQKLLSKNLTILSLDKKKHRHFSTWNKLWTSFQLLHNIPQLEIIHLFKVFSIIQITTQMLSINFNVKRMGQLMLSVAFSLANLFVPMGWSYLC